MADPLTIHEYISPIWKKLTVLSIFGMLLFGAGWILCQGPLWTGIFRLMTFACFAAGVMAYLQTSGRTDKLELTRNNEHLVINYYVVGKKDQEELFEINTIDSVINTRAPAAWKVFPRINGCRFLITFTDSDKTLSLFRYEGRDIFVSSGDAENINRFLAKNIPHAVKG